jgi:hypothetical protein
MLTRPEISALAIRAHTHPHAIAARKVSISGICIEKKFNRRKLQPRVAQTKLPVFAGTAQFFIRSSATTNSPISPT